MEVKDIPIKGRPTGVNVMIRPRRSMFTGGGCLATDSGAASQAAAAMNTLNNSCGNAVTIVNQNPLGRYEDNGSCTYDCSMEQTWNWWADYRPTNSNLVNNLGYINIQGAYHTAFQPGSVWVVTNLPAVTNSLMLQINTIRTIDEDILRTGNETPEQQAQLQAAFTAAFNLLAGNVTETNQCLQVLAVFVNNQLANTNFMKTRSASAQSWIISNATGIKNDLIGKISCGSGSVENSFNNMFNNINAKFVAMNAAFGTVDLNFETALHAVETVAGAFLPLQSQETMVAQSLAKAQSYKPSDALRKMYLNITVNEWNGLVADANTQLQ